MQFEALNTTQWVCYWLLILVVFLMLRKKFKLKEVLKFKYFFLVLLGTTIVTHNQFYSLTEKSDMNVATKKFTFSTNNNTLENYLEDSEGIIKVRTEQDREDELHYQKQKSKDLANQIEKQSKEK